MHDDNTLGNTGPDGSPPAQYGLTGTAFEQNIAALIRSCGFVSVRGGWPDFAVFASDGRFLGVIEAKGAGDTVRPNQHLMLQALADARIQVRVAHPGNLAEIADWLFALPGQTASPPPVTALVGKFLSHPATYVREHMERYSGKRKKKAKAPEVELPEPVPGCHPHERLRLRRAMTRSYLANGRLIAKASAL